MRLPALAAVLLLGAATVATATATRAPATDPLPPMRVVKSPSCGCCTAWVDYMKSKGFKITVEPREDLTSLKRANGVTPELESCHTAFVGGYVVEGHVPAELVKQLLTTKPAGVKGISVPGMPIGSPGMEQGPPQRYTVYTFDAKGKATVYAKR
jgi:hypothetical protein